MDYMDIRKLTIQAIYLDDELSDILVLKGGNALSILELTRRSSYDLDFSLYECAYTSEELEERFKNAICSHFEENDFNIISFKFNVKPKIQRPGNDPKWGGYSLEFKFIKKERYDFLTKNTRPISINSAYSQEYVNMTGTNDPVLIELSRIGNNINQLTKRANQNNPNLNGLKDELYNLNESLIQIKKQLLNDSKTN